MPLKNILIIKCGEILPKIKAQFGDYDDWIIKASGLSREHFKIVNLPAGDILRHPEDFTATIITDSPFHVNQRFPWINQLKNWLVTARYSNVPVLGIGFGLHIITEAFGGKVALNSNGQFIGTSFIHIKPGFLIDPLFKNIGNSFESYLNYTRQVVEIPPGAEIMAQNTAGIVMAISINRIYGIQFSPEIPEKVFKVYIQNSKLPTRAHLGVKLSSEHKNQTILPNFFGSSHIF
jgi:GMP synthase (glutamine-hydrolysing)